MNQRLAATCLLMFALFVTVLQGQETESEFQPLFNGRDLSGWDGDPMFWRVENGAIVGQTTADKAAKQNTFLIYRGSEFADFELRLRYQVTGYNSGVQYRSVDRGNWSVSGYQCDFEDRWHPAEGRKIDKFSGMFFDERGRMFMAQRGDAVIVRSNPDNPKKPHIEKIGTVGDPVQLEKHIRRGDWNDMTIIAQGNHFVHLINDRVMAIGIDEDASGFRASGVVAFQLHRGPPMKIVVKDIRVREIK